MRMCVGCEEMKSKRELLRIVLSPTGDVSVDRTGKKAGRGAYVCADSECFEKAFKAKRLERSLKKPVSLEVYEALKSEIEN